MVRCVVCVCVHVGCVPTVRLGCRRMAVMCSANDFEHELCGKGYCGRAAVRWTSGLAHDRERNGGRRGKENVNKMTFRSTMPFGGELG